MEATEARLNEGAGRNNGRFRRRARSAASEASDPELHQDERDQQQDMQEISDDEYFALFEGHVHQSVLPSLPRMPGYHLCWLTTASLSDTIQRRLQIGYQLIYENMLPGWVGGTGFHDPEGKPDPFPGVVRVREMVAARIRLSLYNRYMKKLHHEMPLADEEKLRANVDLMKEGLQSRGSHVAEEGDGTAELVQRARPMRDFEE